VIDNVGDTGRHTSTAVTPSGRAVISYQDGSNGNLKIATCGPSCGDGNKTPDEECDDGDTANGDGCSASCTVETCWDCSGDPSVCTPESSGSSCPQDSLFCNGAESCNGAGACVGDGDPCASGAECNTTCNEATDDCFDPTGTPCSDEPNICTVDTCDGLGACAHVPGNTGALCRTTAGDCDVTEHCDGINPSCPPDVFDPPGWPCGDAIDDACTDPDTCDGNNNCLANHAGSGAACPNDGNPCTLDQCDGGGSCAHPAGNAGTQCRADAGQCDVAEQCDGSNPSCPPDGFAPNGTGCNDNNACTQTDQCTGGNCVGSNPLTCNDANPCTQDSCNPASGCVTDEVPQTGCRGARKSLLSITNRSDDDSLDKFLWRWNLGDATTQAEFGNPETSASYTLCIYQSGNGLLWRADVAPSMSLWKPLGDKGWKYKDPDGTANGVQKILLKASTEARAQVLVKGKGLGLPDPTLGNLVTPVTAQLHSSETGLCWGAEYTATKKNTDTRFKAKTP
jgi:cysteine-rich repeat protein